MTDRTTFHPRKGSKSLLGTGVKKRIFTGRVGVDTLVQTFPDYLDDDMEINRLNRQNYLGASYEADQAYFIKVVSQRHMQMHRALTWWRNKVFRMNKLIKPFRSFNSPTEMAKHEYDASVQACENNAALPNPLAHTEIPDTKKAAVLFDYVPHSGKVDKDAQSLRAYKHILLSVRQLHNCGYIHGSIPDHVLQGLPHGEPHVTDPIGAVEDVDSAQLMGIGFDLASILTRYTPSVGALPALKVTSDYYSDVELIAAYNATKAVTWTVPDTSNWVVRQLKSSIDEYADVDATDTFQKIMQLDEENLQAKNPDTSPYCSEKFLEAVEQQNHTSTTTSNDGGNDDWSDTRLGFQN